MDRSECCWRSQSCRRTNDSPRVRPTSHTRVSGTLAENRKLIAKKKTAETGVVSRKLSLVGRMRFL